MSEILKKEVLTSETKLFVLAAPDIAKGAKPGQFVILRVDEKAERIPLTISDYNRQEGTITVIFQEVGKSTKKLGALNEGEEVKDVAGPLGNPSHIENFGTTVCIGGGVGTAVLYPIAKALKETGNEVVSIIGAKSKNLLILEDKLKKISDKLIITTDDGSYGIGGFVTDGLKRFLHNGVRVDRVWAIGPVVMMRSVCKLTKERGIKTIVSLNPIMVDGTGMCGGCRVTVGGQTKFVCVNGPEFDGDKVDFEELLRRQKIYLEEEKKALEH